MLDAAALRVRLNGVRERIARAAGRVGRDPSSVRLVAVSKTFSAGHVRALADAGQIDFGENKLQEALPKIAATADLPLRWHLVGHLQSNKAKKAAAHFQVIHSIDALDVFDRVDQAAAAAGRSLDLLIQVDLAGEPTKHGARPEELRPMLTAAGSLRSARLLGLMVLPPEGNPEEARHYFKQLKSLRDELAGTGVEGSMLSELSMGMSHDFEVAVEEGATLVRVGTALFGERTYP
jgi:PLP dependent protein